MVASLGVIIQGLNTGILPNPTFSETNMYEAVKRVYYENPGALIQVIINTNIFSKRIRLIIIIFFLDPSCYCCR